MDKDRNGVSKVVCKSLFLNEGAHLIENFSLAAEVMVFCVLYDPL